MALASLNSTPLLAAFPVARACLTDLRVHGTGVFNHACCGWLCLRVMGMTRMIGAVLLA